MARKKSSVVMVVVYLMIVLFAVLGVGMIFSMTDGFKSSFGNLRVQYGSQNVYNNAKLDFDTNKNLYFQCKYNFGAPEESKEKYTLKIVPSASNVFDYTQGDEVLSSRGIKDMTSIFNISCSADSFVLYFDSNTTMHSLLSKQYPEFDISVDSSIDIYSKYYFDMYIYSYDLKESIMFSFKLSKGDS